jgi:hypothetical protein
MPLDIGQLDTEVSGLFLEVVSDGGTILYSAAAPGELAPEAAPNLYRYRPGDDEPELLWTSGDPNRSIPKIAGDVGDIAFTDLDVRPGVQSWDLWLLPRDASEPILLDTFDGDPTVPDFVPAFSIFDRRIAWTTFAPSADGARSQLWLAGPPAWEPRLLAERSAEERELWLPSLRWSTLAFVELIYNEDRTEDERHVLVMDVDDPTSEPRRVDESGRATMPVVLENGLVWKETPRGMAMFSWGTLMHHSFEDGRTRALDLGTTQVNYPSAGGRFVAASSVDSSILNVYDLERDHARVVERHPPAGPGAADRPYLSGDLLVWVALDLDELEPGPPLGIRWAFLPLPGGSVRLGD